MGHARHGGTDGRGDRTQWGMRYAQRRRAASVGRSERAGRVGTKDTGDMGDVGAREGADTGGGDGGHGSVREAQDVERAGRSTGRTERAGGIGGMRAIVTKRIQYFSSASSPLSHRYLRVTGTYIDFRSVTPGVDICFIFT